MKYFLSPLSTVDCSVTLLFDVCLLTVEFDSGYGAVVHVNLLELFFQRLIRLG